MSSNRRALLETLSPQTQIAARLAATWAAEKQLQTIQKNLRTVGANAAAAYVARCRKSVQGAIRHAEKLALVETAHRLTEPTR